MFIHLPPQRKQPCVITSSHVTCRGGKDPARLFQEELQGPVEAAAHDDEGGEGQVGPLLSRGKQTHVATDPPSHFGPACAEAAFKCRLHN